MKSSQNQLPAILDFLKRLEKNNNKPWFEKHKGEYKALHDWFKETAQSLGMLIANFDPAIAQAQGQTRTVKVFRIYRDARFSRDKSPYKTNFGACIAVGGEACCAPCYYLHLQPGDKSFIAGGIFMPQAPYLNQIRDHIIKDSEEIRKILLNKKFVQTFGSFGQYAVLKTAPKGYPKDHPDIDLLRLKSFTVDCPIKDTDLGKEDFLDQTLEYFQQLLPLNTYLRKGLR